MDALNGKALEGRVAAIIVAAGAGQRFASEGPPKQYWDLCGEPILLWAVRPFLTASRVRQVIVVLPPEDAAAPPRWLEELAVVRVAGGAQRSDSVRHGLEALDPSIRTVLVHDGARPLVTRSLLDRVLGASGDEAIVPVVPIADTVKEVGPGDLVVRTVPREGLWRVQTPQAFPAEALRRVHAEAAAAGFVPSDDAGLFERYGLPVKVVPGDQVNLKVTTQTDLIVAEALARRLRDNG